MSKTPQDILKERFNRFLHRRKDDGKVVDELARSFRSCGWTVFSFGGTPRGVQETGPTYFPRDLDLVFDDTHFEGFSSAYEQKIIRKNSFGGLKLKIDHLVIDAWPLSSTWAFRNGYVNNPSFENLPTTTFLNIDGIIIEFAPRILKNRRVFECGFFDAWQSKVLDINLERNPFPSICIARTLTIARHFKFLLSARLALYLYEMLTRISLSAIERAQIRHYGHIKFDLIELREIRNKIESYLSDNSLHPLPLFRLDQVELFESLKQSPCRNCSSQPRAIKDFIKWSQDDPDESFIKNLVETRFAGISPIENGRMNKRSGRTNRRKPAK